MFMFFCWILLSFCSSSIVVDNLVLSLCEVQFEKRSSLFACMMQDGKEWHLAQDYCCFICSRQGRSYRCICLLSMLFLKHGLDPVHLAWMRVEDRDLLPGEVFTQQQIMYNPLIHNVSAGHVQHTAWHEMLNMCMSIILPDWWFIHVFLVFLVCFESMHCALSPNQLKHHVSVLAVHCACPNR